MEEQDKYYVPSIEEFHVGFEFEFDNTWGEYRKHILEEDDLLLGGWKPVGSGNERTCVFKKARVKYLNKEDIESLGFKYSPKLSTEYIHIFILDDYYELESTFIDSLNKWFIRIKKVCTNTIKFEGYLKNKSELKFILKSIGVLEENK